MDPRDQAAMIAMLMQSPYMQQGAYGADQAAAAKMRRPMQAGIDYANDPDVQFERANAARLVGGTGAAMAAPFLAGPAAGIVAGPYFGMHAYDELKKYENSLRGGREWMKNP